MRKKKFKSQFNHYLCVPNSKYMLVKPIYTLILFTLIFLFSCTHPAPISENRLNTITLFELSKSNIETHLEYIADIEAQNNVEIRSRVSGYLNKTHVDEGQFVRKGQVLFSIDDDLFLNEYNKAQAALSLAKAEAKTMEYEMKNTRLLVEKSVVNQIELEIMQAKLEAAEAKVTDALSQVNEANIRLSHTQIKAPFDGYVDRLPFKTGSMIDRGELLTTVSDVSFMNVYFNVSETEYLKIKKHKINKENTEVGLVLADGSEFEELGKIETVDGEFESGTGTIAFRAKFKNPNKLLKHNATGKIKLSRMRDAVFVIPQQSCFEIQEKTFVFKMLPDSTVKSYSFIPTRRFNSYYLVEGQFEEGDKIVHDGIQKLKDGMRIRVNKIIPTPQL